MRRGLWAAALISVILLPAQGADLNPAKIDAFLKKLTAACATGDPTALEPLYEWTGAPPEDQDAALNDLKIQFDWARKQGATTPSASFIALDFDHMDPAAVNAIRNGQIMNGRLYKPNLIEVGEAKVAFASPDKKASVSLDLPLGISSDGEIRIVCLVPQSGAAAFPREKIDAFVQRVDSLCRLNDVEGLKYLYDWERAQAGQIDTEIATWEYPLSHRSYAKTEFLLLKDATTPNYNPDAIRRMSEGYVANGKNYRPNLPVLGFVTSTFTDASGVGDGNMRPVGLAPDGTIRFISAVAAP